MNQGTIPIILFIVLALCQRSASAIQQDATIDDHGHGWPKKKLQEGTVDECPLTLNLLNYDTDCFDGASRLTTVDLYNLTLPLCCLQVFSGMSKLMATYTNTSGRLFLDGVQERQCMTELVNVSSCADMADAMVAGKSACAFDSRESLVGNLTSLHSSITFASILHDCALAGGPAAGGAGAQGVACDTCANSFNPAVALLSASLHDHAYVCAAAVFLAVLSTDVDNLAWTESLYGCARDQISFHFPKGPRKVPWISIIIVVMLGTLGALIVAIVFFMKITRKKPKTKFYGDINPIALKKGIPNDSYHMHGSLDFVHSDGLYTFAAGEIMKATQYFSDDNFLGEGSAGKVFKGVLPSGQFVAVKRINRDKKLHTFKAELANLSKVRHAHLVTLLGYCSSPHEYYLVYEYCSKGDLSNWLLVAQDDPNLLSWEQRVRIAVNSARGLWFLHYYPGGSIVHRDIKPTNILLNEHMEAKLSDFGLARYIGMEESYVFTEVKGTTGYLDPEYMSMGELTKASDVYSFGIVLLQLISGRRAIDLDPRYRLSLIKTAKLISDNGEDLREFADPGLQGRYSEMAMLKMFRVAILCIASSRHERLTMKEVLQNLEDVLHLSLQTMPHPPPKQVEYIEHTTSPTSLGTPLGSPSLSSGSPSGSQL